MATNPNEMIPSGLSRMEWENYLARIAQHESGTSELGEIGAGSLKVLSAITAVVSVLSIMMQQVTFQYFIYEEASQLTKGVIKQLTQCGHRDLARFVLDWYQYELDVDSINYHIHSKALAPISWEAFERDIRNMMKFIWEYEDKLRW